MSNNWILAKVKLYGRPSPESCPSRYRTRNSSLDSELKRRVTTRWWHVQSCCLAHTEAIAACNPHAGSPLAGIAPKVRNALRYLARIDISRSRAPFCVNFEPGHVTATWPPHDRPSVAVAILEHPIYNHKWLGRGLDQTLIIKSWMNFMFKKIVMLRKSFIRNVSKQSKFTNL